MNLNLYFHRIHKISSLTEFKILISQLLQNSYCQNHNFYKIQNIDFSQNSQFLSQNLK